jgi:hypothetical protein
LVAAERKRNVLGIFSSGNKERTMSGDAHTGAGAHAAAGAAGEHHGRVTEEKKHYVPLKHRLTVSKALPNGGNGAPGSPSGSASIASAAESEKGGGFFDCCHEKELEEDRMAEFKTIFIGGHPLWYFR